MLNGDGLRVVLWVAGCDHCCKECHNPVTWDPNGGLFFDEKAKAEIFEELEKDYIRPEENNDEDEKAMRSLFNETMNGSEGKKLFKSYDGERGQTT